MNIFHKIALEGLKKSRARTMVTIVGVMLSAAMITAVATFGVSLQQYLMQDAIARYGDWQVGFAGVDAPFVQAQRQDDRVAQIVVGEEVGYAVLADGKNAAMPYLFVEGLDADGFAQLSVRLTSGRLPENSSEVVIPIHVEANGGVRYAIGDQLTLVMGNRLQNGQRLNQLDAFSDGETLLPEKTRTYTVVGLCQRPGFEPSAAPGYTLLTRSDGTADHYSALVQLTRLGQVKSYVAAHSDQQLWRNDNVLRFVGLSEDRLFNRLLIAVSVILVALIVLGSVFLIYNSFAISLNDRMRQFGILMSVGATARQLRGVVLFEGLVIGAIGVPLGILLGLPAVKLVLIAVAERFADILSSETPLGLCISVPVLIATAVISLATLLLSAYLPAHKAAATPVMACIRQTRAIKTEPAMVRTWPFIERLCGLEGTLALKNFKRDRKRYRSIVLSLTLSVVLFVSSSAFGQQLNQIAAEATMDRYYDICFYSADLDDGAAYALYDQLRKADSVTDSCFQAVASCEAAVTVEQLSDDYLAYLDKQLQPKDTIELAMDIQFIEDTAYLCFLEQMGLPTADYTGPEAKLPLFGRQPYTDANGQQVVVDLLAEPAPTLTLTAPQATASVTVQTIQVTTYPWDLFPVLPAEVKPHVLVLVAPEGLRDQFAALAAPAKVGGVFLAEHPGQATAQMKTILEQTDLGVPYTLTNLYAVLEQNRNLAFVVELFAVMFVLMISLIALANVFNTISTNLRLRRRELAMLRSVGMGDKAFYRMMRFECCFYGLKTLLISVPLASLCVWLLYCGMKLGGSTVQFVYPWHGLVVSIIGVFAMIGVTMLYVVGQLKKENIIDALRDDMT